MGIPSPHIAALALGVQAVERDAEFEAVVSRLFRAREEAEREIARIEAARRRGRESAP